MAKPQPAKVSYFFGKGYSDLWNTIKESWSRNIHSAGDQFSLACEKGCFTMGGGMNLIAAISIFTFGSLITAFTTFAHIAVLFAFFAFIYIGFGLLWLIDRIYIMINKIKNACPNPDCQAPFLIPTYECPGCGEKHTNLVPSKYGILKRTCLCGTKLPTTFLNGRGQLKAYCPECDTALSGDTASRQYAFPVIGGPSVGKTCFINMAIDQMMSDVAPARSWEMSFISDTEEKDHALAMKSLNQGVRLMKTELNSLTAYQLMLKLPNEKIGRRIYVYDISGEMFSSSSDVQNNLAYSYANGFIFIIDPLTLNQFAMDVEDKVDLNAYGASSKDFDDILNIMLINLEKMFGLKDKDTLKRNLAVVINKVDIPTLEEKIGETAAQQYLAENAREVMAVEIDKNLIPILSDTLSAYDNVSILNADILKVDIAKIVEEKNGGKPVKVVANLPYYITTPIIMGLFESHVPIDSITVMVQKEVADRMQSGPGTKDYGALSLAVQYYAEPYVVANVPPNCFMPRPKVGSAVIRLTKYKDAPIKVTNEKLLFQLIRASFNQRRKTLQNGIKNFGGLNFSKEQVAQALEEMELPASVRGEALTLEQFAQLSNILDR